MTRGRPLITLTLLFTCMMLFSGCQYNIPLAETTVSLAQTDNERDPLSSLLIQAGGRSYTATLEDNPSTQAFLSCLPLTVNMNELNGNEKYYNLPELLPTDSQPVGNLHTGDLMLYGSDCLVLFYQNTANNYRYTRLGRIDDPYGLADALGQNNVQVTFQLND